MIRERDYLSVRVRVEQTLRCVSIPAAVIVTGSIDPSAMNCEEDVIISYRSPHGKCHSPLRKSVPLVWELL